MSDLEKWATGVVIGILLGLATIKLKKGAARIPGQTPDNV
jgi:hypothetical protein